MKVNNNKKGSNARKLIPAVGMLSVSAVMLATSTYAWFTMSREVEVNNIQMVATVPEDLQISLGELDTGNLALDTGVIKAGAATTPQNEEDWNNTANIGAYYQFGQLMPASSTDGAAIFFTPDASQQGKSVKSGAVYYQADGNVGLDSKSYAATSHAYKADEKSGKTWTGYTTNSGWNNTADDGYYVDIPIWLRTSSKSAVNLNVTGYILDGDTDAAYPVDTAVTGDALRKAVRVAVINSSKNTSVSNLVDLKDASSGGSSTFNNYYNRNNDGKSAVASVTSGSATYDAPATTAATVSVTASTTNGYGAATPYVIRVWLEGEDADCWNATAGQDWKIALTFTNPNGDVHGSSGSGSGGGSENGESGSTVTNPTLSITKSDNSSGTLKLKKTVTSGSTPTTTYEVASDNSYTLTEGYKLQVGDDTSKQYADVSAIIAALNNGTVQESGLTGLKEVSIS